MPLLSDAIERSGAVLDRISGDAPISGIDDDTRTVSEGDLFVCMPSDSRDTHELIPEALGKGAAAVLAHSQEGFQGAVEQGVPAMLSRKETGRFEDAVWRLAAEVLGRPSRKLRVVGATGTNG
ncbi:MAG TPA: Mur ligase domain-containing protein, partial [Fimbriimonadaceae bacterium]|nr:Mur ligase domain-containing protein [Fimbriimonadaceae bacterium]